jgi:3-oxoadipate enol-lactonase
MPEVRTADATLHVEVDGEGSPVSVLAHGLTNSCGELAMLTPLVSGTKVRFCFRGHGHSSSPERGYRFSDFARDVSAVADQYGAEVAIGTSLGAGAIGHLLAYGDPDRFRRLVFLLPAGLDLPFRHQDRMLHAAALMEGKSPEQAIEALMNDPARAASYLEMPWLQEFDRRLLDGLNPVGVPRAIREVIEDQPFRDREDIRRVTAPTLIICREGDDIHPAEVGRVLAEIMPNAELIVFKDAPAMYEAIPSLVARVAEFILA